MGPAPMTTSLFGSSVSEKTVSLVKKPASAIPGMGGLAARAPVAITAREKRSLRPSTSTVSVETNFASPKKTSTPSLAKRSAESLREMRARDFRMSSIAAAKSKSTGRGTRTPNTPAPLTAATARAARSTALDGTQPKFRQSPPMRCFSTIATLAPSPAAPAAETSPAVPPPRTTRL